MSGRNALVIWHLACAVLLFGACTAMPSDGQGVRVDLPATAALSASATAIATGVPTIPTPSVGAKAPKAGKGGKGAQPTASVGEVPTVAAPAAKPGKAGRSAKPTVGPREAGPFLAPEVLGRPTDRSVTANLLPAEDLEVYFEYGAAPGAYTGRTPAATLPGDQPAEVTLDGLQPDTRTYYRIRYRLPGASEFAAGEEHSFTTQRAPGSTFTFDIQGDSHPERVNKQFDPDLYERTLRSAAADRPDFYMTIGDDFSVDNLKTVNADTVTQLYRQPARNGWGWWKRPCSWSTATTSRLRWRTWTARRTTWPSGRRTPAMPTTHNQPPRRAWLD